MNPLDQLDTAASLEAVDSLSHEPPCCDSPDSSRSSASSVGSIENNQPVQSRVLDADGLPLISRERIIDEIWKNSEDHAMTVLELTKAFKLNMRKNGPTRRYSFRQIAADITYIRNDREKGATLVLKKCSQRFEC